MKKIYLSVILIAAAQQLFAQNTFPTTTDYAGIATLSPTHSLTFGSTATGIAMYNTANQTTNYERARLFWDSNVFNLRLEAAGSGVNRNMVIGTMHRTLLFGQTGAGITGLFQFNGSSSGSVSYISETSTGTNSSGWQNSLAIISTMNQSGTAGYRGIWISPYLQSTGSANRLLIDAGTNSAEKGSGTHTSLFVVNSAGKVGIGTTSPGTMLEIQKSDQAFSAVGTWPFSVSANATKKLGIGYDNTLDAGFIQGIDIGTEFKPILLNPNGGKIAINANAASHSLTLGSAGNGVALYRTNDQETNYERVHHYWSGSTYAVSSEAGGTGTQRNISTIVNGTTLSVNNPAVQNSVGSVDINRTGGQSILLSLSGEMNRSTNFQQGLSIYPTISQSGTAGYRGLFISPFESTVGTGQKYLIDAGTNSTAGGTGTHTSKFVVTNAGNVGIGIANPTAKLDVLSTGENMRLSYDATHYGSFNTNDQGSIIVTRNATASTTEGVEFFSSSGELSITSNNSSTPALNVRGNGTGNIASFMDGTNPALTILDGGNVGIGTADTRGFKLAVAGNVISEAVTVKLQSAWPDYVFKPGYQLPLLTDVKAYIDRNQHLPEMPSDQEIAKTGQNLGEINKLLVKKVEELTLYLIENERKLEEQQKENKLLNERLQQIENTLLKLYPVKEGKDKKEQCYTAVK